MTKPRLQPYPKLGAITIANGGVHPVHRGGNFIRIKQADQVFTLRFDDGTEMTVEENDIIKLSPEDQFKKIEVINDSGNSLTFQLQIGFGNIETNNVSISGDIAVINATGNKLNVDDADTQTALAAIDTLLTGMDGVLDQIKTNTDNIADIEALLQNDTDLKAGLTEINGNRSFGFVQGGGTTSLTLVTSGANTNGVIIRVGNMQVDMNGNSGTGTAAVRVAGGAIYYLDIGNTGSTGKTLTFRDIYIAAGQSLSIEVGGSSISGHFVNVVYEVL